MPKTLSPEFLRRLRNEIPIDWLIKHLGWPHKRRDGQFVFLCPRCHESASDVKRSTNLGRCFLCETNFNPINFVIAAKDMDFLQAVDFLTSRLPR